MCSAFYYLNYLVQLYKLNREGKQIRHAREYIKCAIRTHLHTHRKPHTLSRLRRRFFKKDIFSTIVKLANHRVRLFKAANVERFALL